MRVYRMRTYSGEEGEVIRWFARKADAIDAIKDRMANGEFSAIEEYQQAVADVAALREHLEWLAAY